MVKYKNALLRSDLGVFVASRNRFLLFAFAGLPVVAGCSGSDSPTPNPGVGGSNDIGGAATTGGSNGLGGSSVSNGGGAVATGGQASGGLVATGGVVSATGGNAPTGGAPPTGGSSARGGSSATGGRAATGGSNAIGGGAATGGLGATGGVNATGGKSTAGGAVATGGVNATGGKSAAGGAATGGANATGGKSSAGGTTATGGTSATAGTSSSILGATPPMGWNSWNTFACNGLNETVVKGVADTFVSSGMKDVGYQYVNLDDCWMNGRNSSGVVQVNTSKFPAGMASLADYVHGKGLKIGLYSTPGTQTCAGIYGGYTGGVGSLGHETSDAQTYASWGIDYLKYDKCTAALSGFATMRDALKATGRAIFYSINPGDGSGCPPNSCSISVQTISNMWRIGFDINASWSSITGLIDQDQNLYSYAGPGHWNDPDMMEVGNGSMTQTENQAHFSMWCILAAPLIAGNDIRSMSAATKTILTNAEAIAVNQDPLGYQGRVVATPGTNLQVWSKNLTGATTTRAVALFNRGSSAASMTVQWSAIGITGAATVRDLWSHTDLGSFTGSYTASSVPSHGVTLIKVVSAQ
jgi:alpha-galactosidase